MFGINVLLNIGIGVAFNEIVGTVTLLVGVSSLYLNIMKIRKERKNSELQDKEDEE
jgi:hypothetical protein